MRVRNSIRNGLLAASLVGMLAFTGAPSPTVTPPERPQVVEQSRANRKLGRLADVLRESPAVARVDLCLTPGASLGLVHVRQFHYEPPTIFLRAYAQTSDELDWFVIDLLQMEHYEWVNKTQRDVHDIISLLARTEGLREFYNEGFSNKPSETELSVAYLGPLRELQHVGYFDPEESAYVDGLTIALLSPPGSMIPDFTTPQLWGESMYIPGGELVAATRHNLRVLPAESKAFIEHLGTFGQDIPEKLYSDDREDILLDIVAQDPRDLALVVLGGAHAIGGPSSCQGIDPDYRLSVVDNLAAWNARDPTRFRKLSLLEVTPTTYQMSVQETRQIMKDLIEIVESE